MMTGVGRNSPQSFTHPRGLELELLFWEKEKKKQLALRDALSCEEKLCVMSLEHCKLAVSCPVLQPLSTARRLSRTLKQPRPVR